MTPDLDVLETFVDRRKSYPDYSPLGRDRRQFGANYDDLTPAGRDLAIAIDNYKLERHRRFINADELLDVIEATGYRRVASPAEVGANPSFVDRRSRQEESHLDVERRQFTGQHNELSREGRELGLAIDQYKQIHRRRVVSPDELVEIIKQLGYERLA